MNNRKKYVLIFTFLVFIGIGLFINFLFNKIDSKLTPVVIDNNSITIMNSTYKIEDIIDVELLDKVEITGGSGSNTPNTNNGNYKVNGDDFKSRVCIYNKVSPFIRITTKDLVIIFNENEPDKTNEIYEKVIKLTK
ncbi:MAG: hypothetical protein ACRCXA_02915 [Peptostreptococcaceae bacterium]